jgi:hypothetical protein
MEVSLAISRYNKSYIYKTPQNQYQKFCNAFGYSCMVNARNPTYSKSVLCIECNNAWREIRRKPKQEIEIKIEEYLMIPIPVPSQSSFLSEDTKAIPTIQNQLIEEIIIADIPPPNAAAQKRAADIINTTNRKLAEYQRIYNLTTDLEIRNTLLKHIENLKKILCDEDKRIRKLKRHANY